MKILYFRSVWGLEDLPTLEDRFVKMAEDLKEQKKVENVIKPSGGILPPVNQPATIVPPTVYGTTEQPKP